ncbi:sporulation protein [Clostridium novyi A str. 4552]|uniref:Sporulation protein n=1 Tax=Clostridium novyi A str. 4552 TaxID=1444289 RepID=A0A0A0I6J1_CLONO|nr:spore germination protein GerW family protein [Clostridium novyi]KGM97054.1 sporulation protein [Clostridium novyi A str. 4552]
MQLNNNFSDNMNTVFSKVEDYVKTESMMGAPMTVQDKTLVPIVSVSLGYGSGNNSPKDKSASSNSCPAEGVGLGAKIATDAVVVIEKDCVSMLPVAQKSNMNVKDMMDKIPNVLTSIKGVVGSQSQAQTQQPQAASAQQNTSAQANTMKSK